MKKTEEVKPEEAREPVEVRPEEVEKPEEISPAGTEKPEEAKAEEAKEPEELKLEEEEAKKAKELGTVRGKIVLGEKPVEGVTVKLGDLSAVTNKEGAYVISGIRPGMHQASVSCPSDLPYEAPARTVELSAGSVVIVDFNLTEATAIQGHVYGADGKPLEGAVVSGVLCGLSVEKRTTDAQGFFRFIHVTPGRRFVRVTSQGHMRETRDVDVEQGNMTNVDLHLKTGGSRIFGRVSDSSGKPVSAQVLLLRGGVLLDTVGSAADGTYEFASLEPGRYEVTLTAKGYKPKAWYGLLSEETEVNLALEPAESMSSAQARGFRGRR